MNDEGWKDEYKSWKSLKPFQIKLLENGPETLSQAWLINQMWCEWMDLRKSKDDSQLQLHRPIDKDPWNQ